MHFSVPTPVGPQTLCDVKGWRVIGIESKEVSNLSLSQVQDEMRSVGRPITMHFSAMPSVYDVEELKEQLSGDSLTNHLSPLAITTDLSALTGLEQRVKAAPQGSSDRARLEVEHGNLAAAYERAVELCKAEKAMGIPIVVSLNEPKPTEEQKAGSTPVPSAEATAELDRTAPEARGRRDQSENFLFLVRRVVVRSGIYACPVIFMWVLNV